MKQVAELSERITLTARETAAALGISERHLWNLIARGILPAGIKLGGSTRFRRVDVVAAVDRLAAEAVGHD